MTDCATSSPNPSLEAQMDRKSMASRLSLLLLLGLALSAPLRLVAQVPVDENGEPLSALGDDGQSGADIEYILSLTAAELEELVGPIALYPDDLLAIVLPASTYPLEIVQAARFLDELETDGSLQPDESWDESVVALLNYPEVVRMMDKEIDWTWRLGEAVISQQADLLAAVESFRDRAYAAGNLESDEYQTVSNEDGIIEIDPVDEEIIYVPYYEPEEVVVYQPRRVYYYYPHPYPLYYYPYPYGHSFASGYFWGVTTAFTIGWSNHYLHVHHPSYWGHRYYGSYYYGHYYRRPSISVYNSWYVQNNYRSSSYHQRDGDHWRPRHRRSGARPANQRVRNYHYPSGDRDRNRSDYRSSGRSGTDVQNSNRTSSDRNRSSTSANDRQTRIIANNDRRSSSSNSDRRSEIRFRDRSDGNAARANRIDNSARNSNATRQSLTARNTGQSNSGTRISQNRSSSQRSTPARQTTATRTTTRSDARQQRTSSQRTVQRQAPTSSASSRPAAQRQAVTQRSTSRPTVQRQAATSRPSSRPTVQRQAPTSRPSSRPTVQRQAPVQRSAPAATRQRQAAPRQAAPSSNRGQSGAKPQRQQSSRGNSPRQRRPQ
jgi:hypothetical protein